jgi:hypothetical protein
MPFGPWPGEGDGGGDVNSVSATDNRVTAEPTTGSVVIAQFAVADWALTVTRFFAVDGVNGNDANSGFSDVSPADAGAAAKKTLTAISEVIPPNGAGRVGQLYVSNGGVNTSHTYSEAAQFLTQLSGYGGFGLCATGTNPNAGAVAFDGAVNTQIYAGGITVPGLNVGGYNPTGTPTTTVIQMLQVGGGAPALPAEPAAPLGWRIRFDIATSTVALRGICKSIVKVASGTTVTIGSELSVVPSAVDVFYIEKAGVLFTTPFVGIGASDTEGLSIVGIDFQTEVFVYSGTPRFSFCGCNSIASQAPALTSINPAATIFQAGGSGLSRPVGGGLRNAGTYTNLTYGGARVSWTDSMMVGTAEMIVSGGDNSIGDGCAFGAGLVVQGSYGSTQWNDGADSIGGIGTTPVTPTRFLGPGLNVGFMCGLQLRGSRCSLRSCDFQNMGGNPAILLLGTCDLQIVNTITGSTGNTDVGLDLTQSQRSRIVVRNLPSVTGTLGDIRLAGGQIISWAEISATGIIDSAGNTIMFFTSPPVVTVKAFSGILTSSEGTVFTYLADTGIGESIVPGSNQVDPTRYPISFRLITRLRACAPLGTPAGGAVTFTLYKNGAATAMTCTIAASSGAGTKASDLVHPILFLDGDDYDLRADAGIIPSNIAVSAILEGPS